MQPDMQNTKQTISKLLVAFADALNSMDDREFDLLVRGEGNLRFVSRSKNGKQRVTDAELEAVANEVARKLDEADSREVAESLLASINQPRRKSFLILLARALGVHVESRDNIATMERKLIETTVGSKLRSKAFKEVAF